MMMRTSWKTRSYPARVAEAPIAQALRTKNHDILWFNVSGPELPCGTETVRSVSLKRQNLERFGRATDVCYAPLRWEPFRVPISVLRTDMAGGSSPLLSPSPARQWRPHLVSQTRLGCPMAYTPCVAIVGPRVNAQDMSRLSLLFSSETLPGYGVLRTSPTPTQVLTGSRGIQVLTDTQKLGFKTLIVGLGRPQDQQYPSIHQRPAP